MFLSPVVLVSLCDEIRCPIDEGLGRHDVFPSVAGSRFSAPRPRHNGQLTPRRVQRASQSWCQQQTRPTTPLAFISLAYLQAFSWDFRRNYNTARSEEYAFVGTTRNSLTRDPRQSGEHSS